MRHGYWLNAGWHQILNICRTHRFQVAMIPRRPGSGCFDGKYSIKDNFESCLIRRVNDQGFAAPCNRLEYLLR